MATLASYANGLAGIADSQDLLDPQKARLQELSRVLANTALARQQLDSEFRSYKKNVYGVGHMVENKPDEQDKPSNPTNKLLLLEDYT